ncbi:MAG TPA: xanthine dehydrogenase family protein molybdopterin-binding subunit [Vicinamibacteria bacterium]|nr:xanthine dehydrogenase family protein molybdopterin-binding subunit [Vicinamibacteria bacterium]
MAYVGRGVKRVEDPRFIQGKGSYVANLSLPGMVYLAIKRSPYGHAKIKKIDTRKASAFPGVVGVLTGKDLVDGGCGPLPCGFNVPDIKVPAHHALALDRVRHVGDRVAVVAAETPYAAADAVELIEVSYEPLDAVVDPRKASEEGAPLVHDDIPDNVSFRWNLGDKEGSEAALREADRVVELELVNQRLIPNAVEPRACAARWDSATGEMTIWTTSQNPQVIRLLLSAFTLGIPENRLRVISPDVGGGFGSKIPHYPEEIITPFVARALDRPTKWVATRSESSISDSQGRDHVTLAKLAMKNDGTFTGLHVKTWAAMGAYVSTLGPLIPTALYATLFAGLYRMKGIYGEIIGTMTHTVPVDAYRGAGRPEASYMLERLVDLAARELGLDPLEIRKKNLIGKDNFPYQTPVAMVYDSGNYPALFDKAAERSDYQRMRKEQGEARKKGRLVGVGVSGCIEASGPAPSAVAGSLGCAVGLWESGVVRVHPTGKVTVLTGSHAHGQGHETTFAQVVADELGVAMEDVEVVHGDTGRIPFGMGTYGSRSAAVGGSALVKSAEKVRQKLIKIAAHQLEAAEDDMVYDQAEGKVYVKGSPDKAKPFAELAFAAYTAHNLPAGLEPGLEETSFYDPANFTFPASVHIAQVEVDPDTGEVAIQRYVAVDDVGHVINPTIVEGQIAGGIVQGIGQALWEQGVYGEDGQLLTGSLMEYAMPRAESFPRFEIDRIETPSPHNPLGVKGAGEMGTIAATVTVANAVLDALDGKNVRHIDIPLTPEKIWKAMRM